MEAREVKRYLGRRRSDKAQNATNLLSLAGAAPASYR
jgi:hypothetical protein